MIPFFWPEKEPAGYTRAMKIRPFMNGDNAGTKYNEAVQFAEDNNWSKTEPNCIIVEIDDVGHEQAFNLFEEGGSVTKEIIAHHCLNGMCKWNRIQSWLSRYLVRLKAEGYDVGWIAGYMHGISLDTEYVFDQDDLGTNVITAQQVIDYLYTLPGGLDRRLPRLNPTFIAESPTNGLVRIQQARTAWNHWVSISTTRKFTNTLARVAKTIYPNVLVSDFNRSEFHAGAIIRWHNPSGWLKTPYPNAAIDASSPSLLLSANLPVNNWTGDHTGHNLQDNQDALTIFDVCVSETEKTSHKVCPWVAGGWWDSTPDWWVITGSHLPGNPLGRGVTELTGTLADRHCPYIMVF